MTSQLYCRARPSRPHERYRWTQNACSDTLDAGALVGDGSDITSRGMPLCKQRRYEQQQCDNRVRDAVLTRKYFQHNTVTLKKHTASAS